MLVCGYKGEDCMILELHRVPKQITINNRADFLFFPCVFWHAIGLSSFLFLLGHFVFAHSCQLYDLKSRCKKFKVSVKRVPHRQFYNPQGLNKKTRQRTEDEREPMGQLSKNSVYE